MTTPGFRQTRPGGTAAQRSARPVRAAPARPSRQQLVTTPQSGARPLGGTKPAPPPAQLPPARQPRPTQGNQPVTPSSRSSSPPPAPAAAATSSAGPPIAQTGPGLFAGGSAGEDFGGAVLALFLWPLIFNLVKGGPAQMWGWIKAKFINEPWTGAPAPAATGTTQAPGTKTAGGRG